MTDMCEIAESQGTATSSCPVTAVAVMIYEAGAAASGAALGVTLGLSSVGTGSTPVSPYLYTPLTSSAVASSSATSTTVLAVSEESTAAASSAASVVIPLALSSSGAAESRVVIEVPPQVLTSTGAASSVATPGLTFGRTLISSAQMQSALTIHLEESVAASAASASSVAHLLAATTTVASTASAVSGTPFVSLVPNLEVLESVGAMTSAVSARTDWTAVVSTSADSASTVLFKDPGRIAWVMNTESTAMSWYDNFDIESIAQVRDTTLAVGPEGIFELTGDTDAGETIDAVVRSGFRDFGSANTKRIDTMYLGYISTDTLAALLRVKDSGHPAAYFTMEPRDASAPRTSRITPGKGMWGRYWQIELQNVNGGAFTVYDMDADFAVSQRKL